MARVVGSTDAQHLNAAGLAEADKLDVVFASSCKIANYLSALLYGCQGGGLHEC